ncbi:MAG: 16S rRNA (guanine(966)-N(2))-methyltransferase RsmD [Eubacteriales bacterium]|nr:16S rRNA (guanine(966)-N(2))-methyltransferase RsmD [Eubacteriales bacterium]
MRVITGTARGKKLETLKGNDVRPTTDMVKEAVFSIIQFQIPGRRFLDMFSGSGQMGIEALSRGAKEAYFLDMSRDAISVIKKNLEATGLSDRGKVANVDSLSFVKTTGEKFDVVFLDPPYGKGICEKALEVLPRVMNRGGVIICETEISETLPETSGDFALDRTYRYGKIKITTYRLPEEE